MGVIFSVMGIRCFVYSAVGLVLKPLVIHQVYLRLHLVVGDDSVVLLIQHESLGPSVK